jgi:hypothetical protein
MFAAFGTLTTLAFLSRELRCLEEEATITSRIQEGAVRYVRYLLEHGHPDTAMKLDALLVRLMDVYWRGQGEMYIWRSDVRESCTQSMIDRWETARFPKIEAAIFLGVAFAGVLLNWMAGFVDLFGVFALGYIMVALFVRVSSDHSLKNSRVLIMEYRGALQELNIPLVFEREETAEAPPPSEEPHTDDGGTRWSTPRAD